MTIFSSRATLAGLKPFQKRTVNHVFRRFYRGDSTTDRFLVADETGLGKSVVAAGVVARVIETLEEADDVERIDIVYMCSNADLAKQNIDRVNVTRQGDVIQSGRLTLLPLQLGKLNSAPAENTGKRVNFISLTPGTSFSEGQRLGNSEERAVLFLMLEALLGERESSEEPKRFPVDMEPKIIELLRGNAGVPGFMYEVTRYRQYPDGFAPTVREAFRQRAKERHLMRRFKKILRSEESTDRLREDMPDLIREFRTVLAEVGLECLKPDLIILDEFQRFQDLLRGPADESEVNGTTELARQFLNYKGAKLLLLSATPYKAHTSGMDDDGEDHASEFTELLEFLSKEEPGWMSRLQKLLSQRRHQLAGIQSGDNAAVLERHLKQFMCRTERPQLGDDDMLRVHRMVPNDVRPADLRSLAALTKVSHAAGAGNPIEYWKSVPYFANFLGGYQLGRAIDSGAAENHELRTQLPALMTIDRDDYRSFKALEGDNAKYRAVERHVLDGGLWKLLWMPPSCPYTEPSGPFADIGAAATKQLLFSAWNATPNAVSALLSYEAERLVMAPSGDDVEDAAEPRPDFTPRMVWRMRENEPSAMSALALFIPHAGLAGVADPLYLAGENDGDGALGVDDARERAESAVRAHTRADDSPGEGSVWAAYFGTGGALPKVWMRDPAAAREQIALVGEHTVAGTPSSLEGEADETNFMSHVARMLETVTAGGGTWRDGVGEVALNSPANCVYRALGRILPASFDAVEHWQTALYAVEGLRTLFNRQDATALLGQLYPTLDYWQAILKYCADGNLQAVMDEYVFQLRSQQPRGPITGAQLRDIAESIRGALSLTSATLRAKSPGEEARGLAMGTRFAVRYSAGGTEEGGSQRLSDVRRSFNSPFWPFVLTSTSVGQEGIDFHWWSHSVIHWNVPSNPVDFEQREGRVHRYMGHAVRKNVAAAHRKEVLAARVRNPWGELFRRAEEAAAAGPVAVREFAPYWVHPGDHRIERRLLDHPLSRDVPRTQRMLSGLAGYRLALGQARQDDLLETLRNTDMKPLDLSP